MSILNFIFPKTVEGLTARITQNILDLRDLAADKMEDAANHRDLVAHHQNAASADETVADVAFELASRVEAVLH
jgi:hypothetical protein